MNRVYDGIATGSSNMQFTDPYCLGGHVDSCTDASGTDKPIARSHVTVDFRPAFASFSLFFDCVLSHP